MKTTRQTSLAALILAAAATVASTAQAQSFSLEGAVIDSSSSRSLGVITERGDIAALFRAQKAMTFGILRSAGISLEQLPPDIRARIERFQTTNVEAFRAFSQGLDLKDQGKFLEAREFFRRAAELDPNFSLASEQRQAMPDVNLGTGAQARAVVLVAAGQAVDRGKASFVVDAARAATAIAAGATVITTTVAATESAQSTANAYTTNPAGSGSQYVPNLGAALTYTAEAPTSSASILLQLASAFDWSADEFRVNNGVLESGGSLSKGFLAQRGSATVTATGNSQLADGSTAYWGRWLSAVGSTATVTLGTRPLSAPDLGPVDYVIGDATRVMPSSGTAVFTPTGGSLANTTGTVAVNFVNRSVAVQNLGFSIGTGLSFAGLNGNATFSDTSRAGLFSGNYSSGTCTGCVAFSPANSNFSGSFLGRNADGLAFSTFLFTDVATSVSGAQLFKRQP